MKYRKEDIPKMMESNDFAAHETAMGKMNVGYEIFRKEINMDQAFKGLANDRCQARHWGYVLKGTFEADFGDHKETYEEGDVYYLPPGHVPHMFPDTEVIEFSPKEEYEKTMEIVAKNMASMISG